MEDHFKETLRKAAANEPPVLDAWDRFERSVRRDRRWRFTAAIAGLAAVIVAAVIVVPQLGTGGVRVIPPLTNSPTPGSPSPSADPYAGWQTYTNADQFYRLKFPAGWRYTMNEAVYEFVPDGLDATDAKGAEGSFGVIVNLHDQAFFGDKPLESKPGAGPDDRTSDVTVTHEGTVLVETHRIDWSASRCITLQTACDPGDDLVLTVRINGEDNAQLMGKYRDLAELLVQSLERLP
jgi:hypothetical protein